MCGGAVGQSDSESGDLLLCVIRRFIGHHTRHALSHGLSGKTRYCPMYYCLLRHHVLGPIHIYTMSNYK